MIFFALQRAFSIYLFAVISPESGELWLKRSMLHPSQLKLGMKPGIILRNSLMSFAPYGKETRPFASKAYQKPDEEKLPRY
jgi:hypothetical protein